jgi:HAE1 family hydrophobic/amphiphilic exporter-1
VVGGLITSTLLTLLVVPVVYTVLNDVVERIRRGQLRDAAVEIPTGGVAR